MRYLLLSDIHSNHLALQAVLKDAKAKRWDEVIFLGDAVGYYTHPNEVIDQLRALNPIINILGNHDDLLIKAKANPTLGVVAEESIVLEVIEQQAQIITAENHAFLKSMKPKVVRENWEVAHGGLRKQWEYVVTLQNAQTNVGHMQTNLCFLGHTHVPVAYASVATPRGDMWRTFPFRSMQATYRIPPNAKVFFNPGSVGQPRDGMPYASYAIFDEDIRSIEHYRVEFDILGVQRFIREFNFPEALAKRLLVGK